jgi:hypothetical protein
MVFKYLASNVNYGRGIIITPQSMTTTVKIQRYILLHIRFKEAGVLLLLAISMNSTEGRKMLGSRTAGTLSEVGGLDDWIMLVEKCYLCGNFGLKVIGCPYPM